MSQRGMAARAGVAFRTLQLLESGGHDPRLSTLSKLAQALGLPPAWLRDEIEGLFALPEDSVAVTAARIRRQGTASWKLWLFNFVDAFRAAAHKKDYIEAPPGAGTPARIRALLAATVSALCAESGIEPPLWCATMPPLPAPWFVAGVESLKAMALVQSPVYFRQYNIFVLDNFLKRA